ncbi:MAG TPA: HNH endonuclease [Planctomycetaceae bacterium]|nr:HNH endonuclease [Planctomycetaceae bacterium]
MDAATRRTVRERAGNCCEYCGLHQDQSPLAVLHVEHVVPKKHGGSDALDNLALACIDCNLHKGTNIAGYDPQSGMLTELFHPRRHAWVEHFERQGLAIVGVSAIGRTTVAVLNLNSDEQLQLRAEGEQSQS